MPQFCERGFLQYRLTLMLSLLSLRLEGRAESFVAGIRVVRSNGDFACRTVGVAIMVVAILHVALDPLDMITAAALALLHFFHGSLLNTRHILP